MSVEWDTKLRTLSWQRKYIKVTDERREVMRRLLERYYEYQALRIPAYNDVPPAVDHEFRNKLNYFTITEMAGEYHDLKRKIAEEKARQERVAEKKACEQQGGTADEDL